MKIRSLGLSTLVAFVLLGCTSKPNPYESSPKSISDLGSTAKTPTPAPGADMMSANPPDEGVSAPANISGSYLVCEVIEGKINPDNSAQIGCRAANEKSTDKIDLNRSFNDSKFSFQQPADEGIKVSESAAEESSPYHVVYSLIGGDKPLSLDILKKMMVMFKGTPTDADANEFVFAARLVDEIATALPEDFLIYFKDGGVGNQPAEGAQVAVMPTVNKSYPEIDGCYMACYSNSSQGSVYGIPYADNKTIYVMGQFRVKGLYSGKECKPADKANHDADCAKNLPACAAAPGGCWSGGDTGGFFGL